MDIKERIEKDIEMFYGTVKLIESNSEEKKIVHLIELSKMYAKDAKSYLEKGDLYTAFACISYAHGILDAVRELMKG